MVGPAAVAVLYAALAAPPKLENAGRVEFEEAVLYFEAEEYEEALVLFKKAYDLSGGRPGTVKGMAQCERALKNYDQAILYFEEYLRSKPEDAARIRKTITLLRQQAKQQAEEGPQTPPIPRAPPSPKRIARPSTPPPTSPQPDIPRLAVTPKEPTLVTVSPAEEKTTLLSNPLFWVAVVAVAAAGEVGS